MKRNELPALVAHADWSTTASKRWLAWAQLDQSGIYLVQAPQPAGDTADLLTRLQEKAGGGATLLGFDFPIGLPIDYAQKAGIDDFLAFLDVAGTPGSRWEHFFLPAASPDEISLTRPFYPMRPGAARRKHLLRALDAPGVNFLLRACERAYPGRRAAAPLFWTMGAQQVGKAAIHGWQKVIQPALRAGHPPLAIWPFSGRLHELLRPGAIAIVETYPAEFYRRAGVRFIPPRQGKRSGKRVQVERAAAASGLLAFAKQNDAALTAELVEALYDGFGPASDGEDRFDAAVGLLGMIAVLRHPNQWDPPEDEVIHRIEGWIFGQARQG
jgi:hypothetical protein